MQDGCEINYRWLGNGLVFSTRKVPLDKRNTMISVHKGVAYLASPGTAEERGMSKATESMVRSLDGHG